jgi:hypothetical protein
MSHQAPDGGVSAAAQQRPTRRGWDIPLLIKILLLLIVIGLLLAEIFSGEFKHRGWPEWLILALKILLILVLLFLIWVQRWLKCELTAPKGCIKEHLDTVTGSVYVVVEGTATGAVFGHYTVDVQQNGDPPYAGIVSYPGGGASGGVPVVNGELARINTATLADGAYIVTLTVYPLGFGSPSTCTTTFNLLKVVVVITRVGKIPTISMAPIPDNPNPFDETSMLRKDFAVAPPPHDNELVSVGGVMTVDGSAYVFGCTNRKLKKYELRYARIMFPPGTDLTQPATLDPIPGDWPVGNRFELLDYVTPDQYLPWTRVGPAPRNLINSWTTFTFFGTTYYMLQEGAWNSTGAGSGRFSLLLTAEDTIGALFHDIQHIWLDNEPVYGQITGIENVAPCADLTLSQFANTGMTVEGIAWDRLIDDAAPDVTPNDNFDRYRLTLYKQGGGSHAVGTFGNRVISPFRKTGAPPTPAEAGDLANFDIVSVIDAGSGTSDPAVDIPRGRGCAYYLYLEVWDKTRLNDDSGTHSAASIWPFCITNDMK